MSRRTRYQKKAIPRSVLPLIPEEDSFDIYQETTSRKDEDNEDIKVHEAEIARSLGAIKIKVGANADCAWVNALPLISYIHGFQDPKIPYRMNDPGLKLQELRNEHGGSQVCDVPSGLYLTEGWYKNEWQMLISCNRKLREYEDALMSLPWFRNAFTAWYKYIYTVTNGSLPQKVMSALWSRFIEVVDLYLHGHEEYWSLCVPIVVRALRRPIYNCGFQISMPEPAWLYVDNYIPNFTFLRKDGSFLPIWELRPSKDVLKTVHNLSEVHTAMTSAVTATGGSPNTTAHDLTSMILINNIANSIDMIVEQCRIMTITNNKRQFFTAMNVVFSQCGWSIRHL